MANTFTFSGSVESVVPRSTKTGFQITVLKLNQHRSYQGKDKTETVEVSLWGDDAVKWASLPQGTKVMVSGRLSGRMNSYNGKEYLNMSLVVSDLALLSDQEQASTEDVPF